VGFLSQVERGHSSLTITSLQRIAEGLGVPITSLFHTVENENFVVKQKDQVPFRIEGSDVTYVRLAGNFSGRNLEPLLVELKPNQSFGPTFSHGGEEFYYVLEGCVLMRVGEQDHVLGEGDAIHFPSSIPHNWENTTEQPAKILCVLTPAIFRK
ncbi:MAG: cupin domain-containing protein, partial [Alicyclobacillus sp.]|nr:cupin domain-containing protein [Alicyclobacillus sp.]